MTAASADLVLLGGSVVTMAVDGSTCEESDGVAIADGRVIAIGGRTDLASLIDERTVVRELPGATILPGFVDSHIHPVFGISLTRGVDLSGCRSLTAVDDALRRGLADLADDDWLLGWGLDPNVFGEAEIGNGILDGVAGDRPARVRLFDAHASIASSSALALAGIDGGETFTDGSRVATDADGRPTGYLLEIQAMEPVEAIIPPLGPEQQVDALRGILHHMAAAGFTSGQVQDLAPGTIELLESIESAGDLPIRLRMSPWFEPGTPLEEIDRLVALQGSRGRRWVVEGVKLMIDGTIDNGTAWLHEPDCLGESTASLWLDPARYAEAITALDARGVPTTTHAIGDAGIAFVLDAIERLPTRNATHRVEHIETMTDAALEVFVASRATASMQPTHCTLFTKADGSDNWSRRLGPERTARGFRMRDLVDGGIPLALGSDWPVAPSDAVGILADAQLRRPHDEPETEAVTPAQALTAMEALRGLTTAPYTTIGDRGGVLEVGAIADITVLDRDPRTAAPDDLGRARVLLTMIGGKPVIDNAG
nr:amidohydrolase [Microbacterium lemovicicum]